MSIERNLIPSQTEHNGRLYKLIMTTTPVATSLKARQGYRRRSSIVPTLVLIRNGRVFIGPIFSALDGALPG